MEQTKHVEKHLLEVHEIKESDVKLYKIRWIILGIYIMYAAVNSFQWFEYSIIANIVMRYYNVSSVAVDWTSIIYDILYMPMVIPASYFIDKKGLRVTALVGAFGTALGTIVKVFSGNDIWIAYLGQTILSSMQVFILSLSPRIAAVWFGPKEVSRACALGVFGTQLGQAIGFILPPMIVGNHENLDNIGKDLNMLFYGQAIFAVVAALAVLIFFREQPTLPPSRAQYLHRKRISREKINFTKSLKNLFSSVTFILQIFAYGINIGVFVAVSTLLNQFVLLYFPNSEEDVGRMGLIMVVLGMLGAIGFGYSLDKTHKYKETTFGIYLMTTVGLLAFTYASESKSKVLVYLSTAAFGLFTNAYMAVGLEFGAELTYPEPECTASGMQVSMTQTLAAVFTLLLGWMFNNVGSFWALAIMVAFLAFGTILTAIIPNNLKRLAAISENQMKTRC